VKQVASRQLNTFGILPWYTLAIRLRPMIKRQPLSWYPHAAQNPLMGCSPLLFGGWFTITQKWSRHLGQFRAMYLAIASNSYRQPRLSRKANLEQVNSRLAVD
jgi:hypothetical protein